MIKLRRHPGCRGVTRIAGLREAHLRVVGVGRTLVVLQVATHAGRTCDVEVIVGVTLRALQARVRPG